MSSEIEIQRVRKDPDQWRRIAKRCLLAMASGQLTDWEGDFLESISARPGFDELSYRQGEILLEIRDDAILVSEYKGQSVGYLVRTCKELSLWFDDEDDQVWVAELFESGCTSVTRKEAAKLSRLLRRYRDMG